MDDTLSDVLELLGQRPVTWTPQIPDGLDALAAAVPRRARRRRQRRIALVGLVASASLAGGTAAAGVWTTHTGLTHEEYGTSLGEVLDTKAPDFPVEARSLVPALPLPDGETWQPYVDHVIRAWQQSEVQGTTGELRQAWTMHAWCAWAADWQADPRPDTAAARQLIGAPGWNGLVIYPDDGLGRSVRDLARALASGDGEQAEEALRGWLPVAGSHAPAGCSGYAG